MASSEELSYRSPYPVGLYGGLGLGNEQTNALFDEAWFRFRNYLVNESPLSPNFDEYALTEFEIQLRSISNNYQYARLIYENFSGVNQKKRASSIIKKIDSLQDELDNLWQLNLPRHTREEYGNDFEKSVKELLSELKDKCNVVASQSVKPGPAAASHIRGAAIDFMRSYENVSNRPFVLSKRGSSRRYFKSAETDLLYQFLKSIDPKITISNVSAVVATRPLDKR